MSQLWGRSHPGQPLHSAAGCPTGEGYSCAPAPAGPICCKVFACTEGKPSPRKSRTGHTPWPESLFQWHSWTSYPPCTAPGARQGTPWPTGPWSPSCPWKPHCCSPRAKGSTLRSPAGGEPGAGGAASGRSHTAPASEPTPAPHVLNAPVPQAPPSRGPSLHMPWRPSPGDADLLHATLGHPASSCPVRHLALWRLLFGPTGPHPATPGLAHGSHLCLSAPSP